MLLKDDRDLIFPAERRSASGGYHSPGSVVKPQSCSERPEIVVSDRSESDLGRVAACSILPRRCGRKICTRSAIIYNPR